MSGPLTRHTQRVDPFLVEAIAQGVIYHGKSSFVQGTDDTVGMSMERKPEPARTEADWQRMDEAMRKRLKKNIRRAKQKRETKLKLISI